MKMKLIFISILLLILVVFVVQNYETVKIQLLFWSFTTSRAIIIFSSLFMGIIIGLIISFIGKSSK